MNYLEIGATICGLIQGYLAMINRRSNWIFYIIQMVFMVAFSLSAHLYGDAVNSFVYIFVGIMGFIIWNRKDTRNIRVCSFKERIFYILFIIIGTYLVYLKLNSSDDPLPLIDSFTTVSSFVATYYMLLKKIDTWAIWFINDIFYCITYLLLPDQAIYLLILNFIWSFMAIGSFLNWLHIMKEA